MTFDIALPLAGSILMAPLLALLVQKRVYRMLPVFVAWQVYTLAASLAGIAFARCMPDYLRHYWIVDTAIDTLFYALALIELGRNAQRCNRAASPSRSIAILLFALAGLLMWSLARWPAILENEFIRRLGLRTLQYTTILETAAFLTLIAWSGLMKLHWPNRELRITTGIGLWTLIAFGALLLHTDGLTGPQYHWIDQLTPAVTLCVLAYWLYSFWLEPGGKTEADRRNALVLSDGNLERQDTEDRMGWPSAGQGV